MTQFVIDDAFQFVWCSPMHTLLGLIQPGRLSPVYGSLGSVAVMWRKYPLPDTGSYWQVYSVGQYNASNFNLPQNVTEQWVSCSNLIGTQSLLLQFFTDNGYSFPLGEAYYMLTESNDILFALRVITTFPFNLGNQTLYIKVYTNDYFESSLWYNALAKAGLPSTTPGIQYAYSLIRTQTDIVTFKALVSSLQSKTLSGTPTICFKNGRYFSTLSGAGEINVGDRVEAIIDSSVKRVSIIPLTSLQGFTSLLDPGINKLFYPPVDNGLGYPYTDTIDFKNEVDFYLVSSAIASPYSNGLYFNQYNANAVRMVTHNSYSLSNVQVTYLYNNDLIFHTASDVSVVQIVRNSGRAAIPLIHEANRILELYKLPTASVINAMIGTQSTVTDWQVANLENSSYTALMGLLQASITESMVESVYGYNYMTKRFCNPYPSTNIVNNSLVFDSPDGIPSCVMSTYDSNGHLLAYGNGNPNAIQQVTPPSVTAPAAVELVPGQINTGSNVNTFLGYTSYVSPVNLNTLGYRCYVCSINNGVPVENWIDVTGQSAYYNLSADGLTITWNTGELTSLTQYPAIVVGGEVLMYPVPLTTTEFPGFVRFSIQVQRARMAAYPAQTTPTIETVPETIPRAVLDVFMDGLSLVEGIDFVIVWPQIVIARKITRTPAAGLNVIVRAYGFAPTSNLTRDSLVETGYVIGGQLSVDGIYETRNDRNYRTVIGGSMYLPGAAIFAEENIPLATNSPLNGLPWSVTDIIMATDGFTGQETMAYRAISKSMDATVGAYLTLQIPGTPIPALNPINAKYPLVSCFLSAIIQNFINGGWLTDAQLQAGMGNNLTVASWIAPWNYLFTYDAALNTNLNTEYVEVLPHPYSTVVTVSATQYEFLNLLITDYLMLNGASRVSLGSYVAIA